MACSAFPDKALDSYLTDNIIQWLYFFSNFVWCYLPHSFLELYQEQVNPHEIGYTKTTLD